MKAWLRHKGTLHFLAGFSIFVIIYAIAINFLLSERKEFKALKERRGEMAALKNEFVSLRQRVDAAESKKGLSNAQGIVQAVDEVFSALGLRDRVKTVKSTGKRETKDGFEEEADIYVEKVSMNEMANIFFRIENAPMVLTVKKATIKKSFESPQLLNINLVLSFLKPK